MIKTILWSVLYSEGAITIRVSAKKRHVNCTKYTGIQLFRVCVTYILHDDFLKNHGNFLRHMTTLLSKLFSLFIRN
jgi:hypothetical protein